MAGTTKSKIRKKIEKAVHLDDFKREYLEDKAVAVLYLSEALAQHDIVFFRECLLEVIKIHGGVAALAKAESTFRQSIHQALSEKGGMKIETINRFLAFVDLKLKVEKVV